MWQRGLAGTWSRIAPLPAPQNGATWPSWVSPIFQARRKIYTLLLGKGKAELEEPRMQQGRPTLESFAGWVSQGNGDSEGCCLWLKVAYAGFLSCGTLPLSLADPILGSNPSEDSGPKELHLPYKCTCFQKWQLSTRPGGTYLFPKRPSSNNSAMNWRCSP